MNEMSALDEVVSRHDEDCNAEIHKNYLPGYCDCKTDEAIIELSILRTENERLKKAVEEAFSVICKGVQLMPLEQLSEWRGVRAWQEECGKDGNHENTIQVAN